MVFLPEKRNSAQPKCVVGYGVKFGRLPNLNRSLIHDLATGRFIAEKVAVLIAGPCGTGKSHLAQAIGHIAARQGHDVLFTTQTQLLASPRNAPRRSATTSVPPRS